MVPICLVPGRVFPNSLCFSHEMRGLLDILSLALALGSVSQTNIPLKGYKVVCEVMTQLLSFLNKDRLLSQPQLALKALCGFAWGLLYQTEFIRNNAVDEMRGCAVQSGHQLVQLLLEWDKEEWSEKTDRSYQGWGEKMKTFWFIQLFVFHSWGEKTQTKEPHTEGSEPGPTWPRRTNLHVWTQPRAWCEPETISGKCCSWFWLIVLYNYSFRDYRRTKS